MIKKRRKKKKRMIEPHMQVHKKSHGRDFTWQFFVPGTSCPRPSSSAGFSLIEILVVLAILGIIMSVAVPQYTAFSRQMQLDSAARQLSTEFRLTQQKALNTGKTCIIAFYLEGHRYRIYYPHGRETVDLPDGISFASINFPQQGSAVSVFQLYFRRSGAPNRGGTVGLKNEYGDRRYVIVTPATGRVRVSHEPPDNW